MNKHDGFIFKKCAVVMDWSLCSINACASNCLGNKNVLNDGLACVKHAFIYHVQTKKNEWIALYQPPFANLFTWKNQILRTFKSDHPQK